MKKAIIQDERIIYQKRKIGSDAFGILYFGLIVSILIQQFMFDAAFSQYAAEFILFMVAAIYVVIRSILVGNNIYGGRFTGQKMVVLNSIVCGLTIAAVTTTLNAINLGMGKMGGASGIVLIAIITFVSGALVAFAALEFLYILNRKRQEQMEAKYNDSDE